MGSRLQGSYAVVTLGGCLAHIGPSALHCQRTKGPSEVRLEDRMKCQLGSDFQGAGFVLCTMKLIIWGGAWRNRDRRKRN